MFYFNYAPLSSRKPVLSQHVYEEIFKIDIISPDYCWHCGLLELGLAF